MQQAGFFMTSQMTDQVYQEGAQHLHVHHMTIMMFIIIRHPGVLQNSSYNQQGTT
jgi:hypothetical protein